MFYPFLGYYKYRLDSLKKYGDVMTIFDKLIKENPDIKIIISNLGL